MLGRSFIWWIIYIAPAINSLKNLTWQNLGRTKTIKRISRFFICQTIFFFPEICMQILIQKTSAMYRVNFFIFQFLLLTHIEIWSIFQIIVCSSVRARTRYNRSLKERGWSLSCVQTVTQLRHTWRCALRTYRWSLSTRTMAFMKLQSDSRSLFGRSWSPFPVLFRSLCLHKCPSSSRALANYPSNLWYPNSYPRRA